MHKTSAEAYVEYSKLLDIEQRLEKKNRGMNLLNADTVNQPTRFFIKVESVEKLTLTKHFVNISVKTNLEFGRYCWNGQPLAEFIKDLQQFVALPRFKYHAVWNRKDEHKPSTWGDLTTFRTQHIEFDNLDITVGKDAEKRVAGFRDEVKAILAKQRDATSEEVKDFERYHYLFQRVADLKGQLDNKDSRRYGNGWENDNTIKFSIGTDSYNKQLVVVGKELQALKKKHPFLELPDIIKFEKPKKPTIKQFKEENTREIEEAWDELSDEDKDQFDGDFEEFCKQKYDEFLEYNDFSSPVEVRE